MLGCINSNDISVQLPDITDYGPQTNSVRLTLKVTSLFYPGPANSRVDGAFRVMRHEAVRSVVMSCGVLDALT